MSFERQGFVLGTTGTDEDHSRFPGLFLELCNEP